MNDSSRPSTNMKTHTSTRHTKRVHHENFNIKNIFIWNFPRYDLKLVSFTGNPICARHLIRTNEWVRAPLPRLIMKISSSKENEKASCRIWLQIKKCTRTAHWLKKLVASFIKVEVKEIWLPWVGFSVHARGHCRDGVEKCEQR